MTRSSRATHVFRLTLPLLVMLFAVVSFAQEGPSHHPSIDGPLVMDGTLGPAGVLSVGIDRAGFRVVNDPDGALAFALPRVRPVRDDARRRVTGAGDAGTWLTMGTGLSTWAWDFTVHDGYLVAGGGSATAEPEDRVARWDGTAWQPLGALNYQVQAVTEYDGDLIAGGFFTEDGGQPVNYIARWDGTAWQPLGTGMNAWVRALTVYEGDLIAAGQFSTAGGVAASGIARWDGLTWQPLGMGMNYEVTTLAVHEGDLIAGGYFTAAGGVAANRIARWDGSAWHPIGTGMSSTSTPVVFSLTAYDGDLIAGGLFTAAGGVAANRIARWDGSAWHPIGTGTDALVWALTVYEGDLITGGTFTTAGGQVVNRVARWDGSEWHPLSTGMNGPVLSLSIYDGDLIAGGDFTTAGGGAASRVARWFDGPAPEASLSSTELTFEIGAGETASQSITLSNLAGEGAADLTFSTAVASMRGDIRDVPADHLDRRAARRAASRHHAVGQTVGRGGLEELYSQLDPTLPGSVLSQYNAVATEYDTITADDFTVEGPVWATWVIEEVFVRGRYMGASPGDCEEAEVIFWSSAVTAPLDPLFVYNVAPVSDDDGDLTLAIPATELNAKTYWLSVVCSGGDLNFDPSAGDLRRWNWHYSGGTPGAEGVIDNFGGGFGHPEGWNAFSSVGLSGTSTSFALFGSVGAPTIAVSVSPEAGSVGPGTSQELTVTVSNEEVYMGEYAFELLIQTNDPGNPVLVVDVTVGVLPVSTDGEAVPLAFALGQNYPNPFAGGTTIAYALPEASHVRVEVYDAVGRRVAVLVDEARAAGRHEVTWETEGLPSGLYLYRIEAGPFSRTMKMALVR